MMSVLTRATLAVAALILGVTLVLLRSQPPAAADVMTGQSFFFPKFSRPVDLRYLRHLPLWPGFRAPCLACPPANPSYPSYFFTPSETNSILSLEQPDDTSLPWGFYQTYPWTLLLFAPKRGIEDRSVMKVPDTYYSMPIIRPQVEAIPIP